MKDVIYKTWGLIVAVVCMTVLAVGFVLEFGSWLARVIVVSLCKTSKAGKALVDKACYKIMKFMDRVA